MRRIAVSVFVALICNFSNAQQAPIVGVWEQLPVVDANGGANAVRHHIVSSIKRLLTIRCSAGWWMPAQRTACFVA